MPQNAHEFHIKLKKRLLEICRGSIMRLKAQKHQAEQPSRKTTNCTLIHHRPPIISTKSNNATNLSKKIQKYPPPSPPHLPRNHYDFPPYRYFFSFSIETARLPGIIRVDWSIFFHLSRVFFQLNQGREILIEWPNNGPGSSSSEYRNSKVVQRK